jgi:hypothetical protein
MGVPTSDRFVVGARQTSPLRKDMLIHCGGKDGFRSRCLPLECGHADSRQDDQGDREANRLEQEN